MNRTTTLMLLAACLIGTSAIAGECYTAAIVSTVTLPDGSQHDAGSIRLCRDQLSPAYGLHTTYVDGMPIGIFRSRIRGVEADAIPAEASLLFTRDPEGRMTLVAAMLPGKEGMRLYDLRTAGSVRTRWTIASALGRDLVRVGVVRTS